MITSFYLALLGLLYLKISIEVILARRKYRILYGQGSDNEIGGIVGAHLNFASYIPFILLGMFQAETSHSAPKIFLHLLGSTVLLGRIIHFLGLSRMEKVKKFKFRVLGMHLTLWPLLALCLYLLGSYLGRTFFPEYFL